MRSENLQITRSGASANRSVLDRASVRNGGSARASDVLGRSHSV